MFHGAASKCQSSRRGRSRIRAGRPRSPMPLLCARRVVLVAGPLSDCLFVNDARAFQSKESSSRLVASEAAASAAGAGPCDGTASCSGYGSGGDFCASTSTSIRNVVGTATKRAISTTVSRVGRARKRSVTQRRPCRMRLRLRRWSGVASPLAAWMVSVGSLGHVRRVCTIIVWLGEPVGQCQATGRRRVRASCCRLGQRVERAATGRRVCVRASY